MSYFYNKKIFYFYIIFKILNHIILLLLTNIRFYYQLIFIKIFRLDKIKD